jgi:hypothetical protein
VIRQGRRAYLVVARGTAISGESAVTIEAVEDSEVLIADLP